MNRRVHLLLFVLLSVAFVGAHVAALFTENVNWDELSLMTRASNVVRSNVLDGAGRPGLGVVSVIPFVDGCTDAIDTVNTARVVWAVFTFALLAGLYVFLVRSIDGERRHHAAALGVACFALVPLFERWSLQVRTDQPALAAAVWGGVALLASRSRPRWAVVAGALFGLGFLFSQKAGYGALLVGTVAAGQHFIDRALAWRRELLRIVLVAVAAFATITLYKIVVGALIEVKHVSAGTSELDQFAFYRSILRFRIYRTIATSVIPHIGLVVLVLLAAWRAMRHNTPMRRRLVVALVVAILGFAIGRFHAASFPYFWMTIGLFPATVIALGWDGVCEMLPRVSPVIASVAWVLLVALGVSFRIETLRDTQAPQRDAYELLTELPATARGFHPEGGLFCRTDPSPLPIMLNTSIRGRFGGPKGDEKARAFASEFRIRPVSFVVNSHRLAAFPGAVRDVWARHYVQTGNLLLAGAEVVEGTSTIELLAGGVYRWWPRGLGTLVVDGAPVNGNTVQLSAGPHSLVASGPGSLVLATSSPPGSPRSGFYSEQSILELSGVRRDWW